MAALAAAAATTCLAGAAAPSLARARATRAQPLVSSLAGQALRVAPATRGTSSRSFPSVKATLDEENQASKLVEDLKKKWDAVDDKTTLIVYSGGAFVAVWLSSTVVSAVNRIPLLPNLLELVGTFYTGWFVYRYLLFKEGRKELKVLVEDLKAQVTGKN